MSIMVSPAETKPVKSFPVQVKQYSYIQSFLLVETIIKTWWPFFKEKLLCSQQKLFFRLVKNSFFHLSDIPARENSFSVKWKRFLSKLFIPVCGNGKSIFFIQSFVEAFEIRRWQFLLLETDFVASRTYFFPFLRYSFQ